MPITPKFRYLLSFLPPALAVVFAACQPAPPADAVLLAQQKITEYLNSLADFHCTESVTQEKIAPNGHISATERAKYDYLIMMNGNGEEFQLNESRISLTKDTPKPAPVSMLVSNGVPTVLLVFHPYYRDSFEFEAGAEENIDGEELIPIHFRPIPGRRAPAALALREREYPLALKGTAWLDKRVGQVVKIDAVLDRDMSDVGLSSLHVHVEYRQVKVGGNVSSVDLPALAVVDVTTPRQHWRNTHVFEGYKSFSIDVEQDPHVNVHTAEGMKVQQGETTKVDFQGEKEKP